MSTAASFTKTFTVADIRKVVDNFAADFSMMAQSTGLRTRDNVAEVVSDLKVFAEERLLIEVTMILKDSAGSQIRGAKYRVSDSATGWESDRPGNALWPRTPGGSLRIVADLSSIWWGKSKADKDSLRTRHEMTFEWSQGSEDTSLSGLSAVAAQRYSSNGYGWARTNYS
jgi:hypothetical protein